MDDEAARLPAQDRWSLAKVGCLFSALVVVLTFIGAIIYITSDGITFGTLVPEGFWGRSPLPIRLPNGINWLLQALVAVTTVCLYAYFLVAAALCFFAAVRGKVGLVSRPLLETSRKERIARQEQKTANRESTADGAVPKLEHLSGKADSPSASSRVDDDPAQAESSPRGSTREDRATQQAPRSSRKILGMLVSWPAIIVIALGGFGVLFAVAMVVHYPQPDATAEEARVAAESATYMISFYWWRVLFPILIGLILRSGIQSASKHTQEQMPLGDAIKYGGVPKSEHLSGKTVAIVVSVFSVLVLAAVLWAIFGQQ